MLPHIQYPSPLSNKKTGNASVPLSLSFLKKFVNITLNYLIFLSHSTPLFFFIGKVPALEIKEDVCIYESLITVEYLDEVYTQRPLLSKDPVTKAYDKIIVEAAGPVRMNFTLFLGIRSYHEMC